MALSIRDKETDAAVRRLAALKNKGLTETILEAVQNELKRTQEQTPLMATIRELQADYAKYPKTGLQADKAFFDELSGDL